MLARAGESDLLLPFFGILAKQIHDTREEHGVAVGNYCCGSSKHLFISCSLVHKIKFLLRF